MEDQDVVVAYHDGYADGFRSGLDRGAIEQRDASRELVWGRGQPHRVERPGVFMRAVPHLGTVFRKRVPAEHLQDDRGVLVVRCVDSCGGLTRMDGAPMPECAGGCGRFFVGTRAGVWSAGPFPS